MPPPSYMQRIRRAAHLSEMASLVAALHKAGAEIWAVSSTNKWVVAEGVRDFSIPEDRVLAAEVRVDKGIITSRSWMCRRTRARPWHSGAWACRPDAVFGNSIHDLAMLEMARTPFPVNPSPALLEAAAKTAGATSAPRPPKESKRRSSANDREIEKVGQSIFVR